MSDVDEQVRLYGYFNGDSLIGGTVSDRIVGYAGDDTIVGGAGADTLEGGDGIDTLSYETSSVAISIDLAIGLARDGDAQGDVISGFENLRGSLGDDLISGDNNNNVIESWGGQDRIFGRGGDDRIILRGAGPQSSVYAGDGYDILTLEGGYAYEFSWRAIYLVEQVNVGDGVTVSFEGIDESPLQFRSGSVLGGGVDLTANFYDEVIRLGQGDDTLDAGAGDDQIYVFEGGAATIDGGDGVDRLYVQSGQHSFADDTLQNVEIVTVRAGASVDLGAVTEGMKIVSTSAAGGQTSIGGTSGHDVIRLGNGGDVVIGGAGDDRMFGGAGADRFLFPAADFGRDQVFADLGADRIVFSGVASGLDDLDFRTSASGHDVVVTIDGLDARTNAILLKNVTIEDVLAAEEFFLFG